MRILAGAAYYGQGDGSQLGPHATCRGRIPLRSPFRTVSGVRAQVLVGLRPSHTRVRPLFSCAAPWVAPPSQVGSWRRATLLIPPEDASWLASFGGVIILLRIILIIILIMIIGMMTIIILMLQHGRRGVGPPLVLLYGKRVAALLSWVHALLPSR